MQPRSFRRFRPAIQRIGLVLVVGLTIAGLSACSGDSRAGQDAYDIGCPALDAAVAGGSVVNRAAVKGLEAIHDSGQLDPDPQRWVETAISVLTAADPKDVPADARKLLVDGCAEHGHPLQNLK